MGKFRNFEEFIELHGFAKLIILLMIGLCVQTFEIVILSFRQVNENVRDNSFMQIKRVTTIKGILI